MIKNVVSISAPILFLMAIYFYGGNIENKNLTNVENKNNEIINENKNMNLQKPSMEIDKNKNYTAILKTTEGRIEVALNAKETPITVNNFIYLARNNFYNGVVFHRVIKDFMIQGGDPTGTGMGDPGYKFNDEPFSGQYTRGTIAMANSGPNTNGSQFFIMHADVPLSPDYVIFGNVIKGIEVVDKIASASTVSNGFDSQPSKPVKPVVINSVEIVEQ